MPLHRHHLMSILHRRQIIFLIILGRLRLLKGQRISPRLSTLRSPLILPLLPSKARDHLLFRTLPDHKARVQVPNDAPDPAVKVQVTLQPWALVVEQLLRPLTKGR